MGTFLRVLITVTAVAHLPVAAAFAELLRRLGAPAPWALGFVLAAGGVALFIGRSGAGLTDRRRSTMFLRLVDIPFFVHWCAAIFALIPSVVATLTIPWLGVPMTFYMAVYLTGLAVAGYGILIRRRWFVVKHVTIPIEGLDPALDGLRIAHLSDLHIGAITPKSWGDRWVRAANEEGADVAVITGDMVTSGVDFHQDIAAVVGGLRAPLGVYVSMGNHDYFGEGEPLISMLNAGGAQVLRNEGRVLSRNGKSIYLAAIDDTWTRRDDMYKALQGRPAGVPCILLAHDPEKFLHAAKANVDLTLSGHTHGGQIAVPFLARFLSLSHLTHHFHVGIYRKGRATLYVHPGLGTTGPPVRIGVAPAVVIHTLRAA
ncbi:metallophosphoesterase [Pendulispora brunnea]|uniref:Metallophosphoesterase n=1 Tax=Pendulispora brunnea TaxID=2905690 RepID=A0ABZ2K484_9BACT